MRSKQYFTIILICLSSISIGQIQAHKIRALSIGDTVPDIEFANIVNHSVSKIRLSDFKGKHIILDFWGRFCSSCIIPLSRLDSFQQAHKNRVQVITISDFTKEEEVYNLLNRIGKIRNLKLPILLGGQMLSSYFPHRIVSHLVWIGRDGIVKAITGSEYVTKENLQTFLDGKPINWSIKNDIIDFDYKRPFLDFAQTDIIKPDLLYYSTITGYLDGIAPPTGTFLDSINNVAVTSFYNLSLLQLCGLAMDYRFAKRKQFILQVQDTTRYVKESSAYYKEWAPTNTYCYNLRSPINLSEEERIAFIQSDILRWLLLLGVKVTKQVQTHKEMQQPVYIVTEK